MIFGSMNHQLVASIKNFQIVTMGTKLTPPRELVYVGKTQCFCLKLQGIQTLNKNFNWSPFKLIISGQALITLNLPKYVQFNGQKFSGLLEKLSFNPQFFGLNMQKSAS